jgi:hypothetical protein
MLQRAGKEAKRLTENPAPDVTQDNQGWRRLLYSYFRFYGDYGSTAFVDFRIRGFGDQTFVFVFMYTYNSGHEETIGEMLDSFKVKRE